MPTPAPTLTPKPTLAGSLNANRQLAQWLTIASDGLVWVRSGKVELGQGIRTTLAQIVAQELSVDIARIRMVAASTSGGPNEGVTAGSLSVQDSGGALRQVCAEVRAIYLLAATQILGLLPHQSSALVVTDGRISLQSSAPGQVLAATSYWALANDALLTGEASGLAAPQPPDTDLTQQTAARLDIPGKVTGQPVFIQDMSAPGMLYGRVLHPPSPGAQLLALDLTDLGQLPGVVATVRDGSFIGLVARDEYAVVRALARLSKLARWQERDSLPDQTGIPGFLRAQACESAVLADQHPADAAQPPAAAFSLSAAYARPFLAHASIAPSCAVACFQADPALPALQVWTHSQGIFNLRADLALVLKMPVSSITVHHVEGAGCYGHNGADDAACDAALLARAVPGQTVQLLWTREDELGIAPFGAAMAVDLAADVGSDGLIAAWQHTVWSSGHSLRPGRSTIPTLLAATTLADASAPQVAVNMPLASGGGSERNALPLYDLPRCRVVSHRTLTMPIRSSSLRSLGAHCNLFAIESFMDELATGVNADPLAFRLRNMRDQRAKDVLSAAADMADWAHRHERAAEGHGVGLSVGRYKNTGAYCAVVADVEVERDVRVNKLWIAVDVGRVVNRDGVVNQIEGGAIQTVSWTLKEAVQFDRTRITSTTWETYPILRFSEVPAVHVKVIDRPLEKSLGAGEATHGQVSAAIANAIFDALGVRLRHMPFTRDAITQAALA